jgi:transmembrane sensor
MTSPMLVRQKHERAWELLGSVENHPQVQSWLRGADEAAAERKALGRERATSRRRVWTAAASVIAVAIGVAALGIWSFSAQRYETGVGEQRDVVLADGSKVTLNTNSAVTVRYSKSRRYLVLEHGEALFAVAHNAARPFDVAAGGTLTRALGTEFNVDMRSTRVTVSVLEGAVQVSAAPAPGTISGNFAAIAKGQAVEFRSQERHVVEERADLERIDAWRTRHLEFSGTPLSEAVEEFNRYSTTRIVIGTPDLGSVRVSGVFRIGDADGFLYSLGEVLGVEAHESANEVVLIRTGL